MNSLQLKEKYLQRLELYFNHVCFGSSILYFLQISSVRFAIAANEYSGLEHLLQSNPKSALLSVNMLGWALFFRLSSLFMYFGIIFLNL